MSTLGSKTQMEPWEAQNGAPISQLWNIRRSPDQSFGDMHSCSLRQKNKVTIKAETHRALAFPLPQAPRREGS